MHDPFFVSFKSYNFLFAQYSRSDIHQLNLIMEILGTPNEEFMEKISSESVSSLIIKRMHIKFLSVQI